MYIYREHISPIYLKTFYSLNLTPVVVLIYYYAKLKCTHKLNNICCHLIKMKQNNCRPHRDRYKRIYFPCFVLKISVLLTDCHRFLL